MPRILNRATLAVTGVLFLAVGATPTQGAPPAAATSFPILACEALGPDRVVLKLLIFNSGETFAADGSARLEFVDPADPARAFEAPEPGPRTTAMPVACSSWFGDHVELLRFGPFVLDDSTPAELHLRGGLEGRLPVPLGALVRGDDRRVRFRRPPPDAATETERNVLLTAACDLVNPNRFLIKLGFFNCGERFDVDYWAFLHFEPDPTGENLAVTTEMGLYPAGKPTDSSSWEEDEVTVIAFGPFELPRELDRPLYLRAGLYDRDGTSGRVPLAGSGEAQRVLVGRFVPRDGGAVFERTAPQPEGEDR